jgi:hypothetical protein
MIDGDTSDWIAHSSIVGEDNVEFVLMACESSHTKRFKSDVST